MRIPKDDIECDLCGEKSEELSTVAGNFADAFGARFGYICPLCMTALSENTNDKRHSRVGMGGWAAYRDGVQDRLKAKK